MTTAICLWSGPRNVSTALMYSFAQNDRVTVIDEPLYGHYLRVTGAEHPGADEVIAAMNCDGDAVMRGLLRRQAENPERRLFMKHMAHHLVAIDLGFLRQTRSRVVNLIERLHHLDQSDGLAQTDAPSDLDEGGGLG